MHPNHDAEKNCISQESVDETGRKKEKKGDASGSFGRLHRTLLSMRVNPPPPKKKGGGCCSNWRRS